MKRIISILLSAVLLLSVCSVTVAASAAESRYDVQKQQYNAQFAEFNYDGKIIVRSEYNYQKDKSAIYLTSSPSKKGKAITTVKGEVGSLMLKGKYIYYVDYGKHAVRRCKRDGSAKKTLAKFDANADVVKCILNGSYLYYRVIYREENSVVVRASTLYRVKTNGKSKKKIASDIGEGFFANSKYLYYIKGKKLKRYTVKSGKTVTLSTGKSMKDKTLIGLEGKQLYFTTYSIINCLEHTYVYRYNTQTKKVKKIEAFDPEDPIHSLAVPSGKVFITTGTGAGNGFARVKGGESDYDTYRSKYDTAGESLGYYQNYLVVDEYRFSSTDYEYRFAGFVKLVKIK